VGLGSSKVELFDVLDIAAGTVNASGLSSINQGQSAAANGDLFKSGAVYKKRVTSGTDTFVGNVSGRSIDQGSSTATTGEIFLFSAASGGTPAVYKTKGTGSGGADETITNPASADQTLLTNALSSSRVQRLRVNFGEDSTDRASLYQSSHKATITNIESAINALDMVDAAAKVVNESRARMGATMSRIEYTINNLMNLVENTEEAKSRVLDTDYAKESAELAKAQILAQAGTAMLAQANQSQQYVLNLLRQG